MAHLNIMTPRQARAARAVLGLSVRELALQSGISDSSIRRIEAGQTTLDLTARLQAHFIAQGFDFRFEDGHCCLCWVESE